MTHGTHDMQNKTTHIVEISSNSPNTVEMNLNQAQTLKAIAMNQNKPLYLMLEDIPMFNKVLLKMEIAHYNDTYGQNQLTCTRKLEKKRKCTDVFACHN